jgi:FkbM family methyltransferase
MMQRARVIKWRRRSLGEVNEFCFYATRLRLGDIAFDIGAYYGDHTRAMLNRGARVISVEPQPVLAGQLAKRFPQATVLPIAINDRVGTDILHTTQEGATYASLDPDWWDLEWDDRHRVQVSTLDELIDQFGTPKIVKIDTEGFDHRVLLGLSQPVEHLLFEVHALYPERIETAFAYLATLGTYELRLEKMGSWLFSEPKSPDDIVTTVSAWGSRIWGNVYARLLSRHPHG